MKTLDEWGEACHAISSNNGFWEAPIDINFVLAKIALIHSECSETLEALRKEQGDQAVLEECADIFVRLVDFVQGLKTYGWVDPAASFDEVVAQKVAKNATRPRKHGNLI